MFEIHPVKKVSVVIPVYNEQESLPELIRRTTTACESLGKEYEILLIDDGSSDNSAHMLVEASQAENSHIVSILLNRNYGQHSAIMAGRQGRILLSDRDPAACQYDERRSPESARGDPPPGGKSR